MNFSMTALTQNSQVCNFIEPVAFIYMMNMKLFIKATNKTLRSGFIFFDISRVLVKRFFASFAKKLNFHITKLFVTCSGAKSCSIFFKHNFASRTLFYKNVLLFAEANVNLKEVINGQV